MRVLIAFGLAGVAAASLAACNKPAASAGGSSGPAVASAAPAAPAAGPLTAGQLPHRKAGLWRQTITMEGVDRAMPVTELCLDDASEAKLSMVGQQMAKDQCQTPQFSRNLDGSISFTSSCDMGASGKTASSGTISGDFNNNYTAVIDSKTTGGPDGANGEHKMTISATRTGPCAPGQKGGDMIMANGMKMNVLPRTGGN